MTTELVNKGLTDGCNEAHCRGDTKAHLVPRRVTCRPQVSAVFKEQEISIQGAVTMHVISHR
jgi:hypothetical protein